MTSASNAPAVGTLSASLGWISRIVTSVMLHIAIVANRLKPVGLAIVNCVSNVILTT